METTTHPTHEEQTQFSIRTFKGIDVGLGHADPGATIAAKLVAQYPGHLVLIQAGKFLHGYDRTAHALAVLKKYKLKLVGTAADPHIRVGFPVGNFKRRLWPMVADFGIPYVVALGSQAQGHTLYTSQQNDTNASVLEAVSDDIVRQTIEDLRQRNEVNKAAAKQLLSHPDAGGFRLKSHAQDLDTRLLHDILKMPRDLRTTYGENIRACMGRIMRTVYAYGLDTNKAAALRNLSADVDLLKYYLSQAPRLSRLQSAFEHRAGLAVELGRLVGGLCRSQEVRP